MKEPVQPLPADSKAEDLQRAFDVFNQVSAELTQAYEALQARVASLTTELAVANGELRRQYKEKEALSERLALLLGALPAGVVVLDSSGAVVEVNPAALHMLGREVPGKDWRGFADNCLEAAAPPDEYHLGERRVAIAESPLDSAGGRILLIHDITAAHEMKAGLERSQRLAAMGEMAASLAHQLRTPLATALLYAANLCSPDVPGPARVRFAEKTMLQLQRLERLIQDVLLFARGEGIGRERIGLAELLAEAVQTIDPLCASHQVALRVGVDVGVSIIMGERKAIFGALVNLLENALQVCEPGGCVSLDATVDGGKALISVRDTGPGVAPEIRARIFEPFYTTKGQGTGLGLAIALAVAKAHGGTIRLGAAEDGGAEFVMELPAGGERPAEFGRDN